MPQPREAKTYPAHDIHPDEHVGIAADPYDTKDKASIFTQNYRDHDMLPIFVVVTNNGDQPISLRDMKLEYVTARKVKILPATEDDLFRRFSRVERRGDEPSRNPLPVPLPRHPKTGVNEKGRNEFEKAMFQARAVEPHETQAGFYFIDIDGIRDPMAGAHLYVTGIRNNDGQELMFFDIPLENASTSPTQGR